MQSQLLQPFFSKHFNTDTSVSILSINKMFIHGSMEMPCSADTACQKKKHFGLIQSHSQFPNNLNLQLEIYFWNKSLNVKCTYAYWTTKCSVALHPRVIAMPLPARLKSGALRQRINQYKWPQSSPVSSSAELAACGGAQLLGCPLTSCGAQPDGPSVGPRHRCSLTAHTHTQLGQTCSSASDVSAAAFHALSALLPNKNINKPPKKKQKKKTYHKPHHK